MSETREIAVLDLSSPDQIDFNDAAVEFKRATQQCGFIYIKYAPTHGTTVQALRREQRLFFDLSPDAKRSISIDTNNRGYLESGQALMSGASRPDQKEVFFWGRELAADDPDLLAGVPLCGPNQWPESVQFRSAVLRYSEFIRSLGSLMLSIVAEALGCDRDFFQPFFQRSMLRGQLLKYPPTQAHPDQFGVAPHSDFGCITLLSQETEGLEVQFPDGAWVAAPPLDSTLVVNIGDLLERWSNMRLPSTRHRVRNTSTDARYSIAMFYDPNPLATVDPLDLQSDTPARFPAVGAAEYIMSRNRQSFAHYKNQ
jgi:isopenicillin N synthase-like dioxygenase